MNILEKINKYGVFKSGIILLKKLFGIRIEKFHYLKLKIDIDRVNQSLLSFDLPVKQLKYEDFLLSDSSQLTHKKLLSIKSRLSDGDHIAYGIIDNNQLIYSNWVSLRTLSLPIKRSFELLPNEGSLEDGYCRPQERGKGIHSKMNYYILSQLYHNGKDTAIAIVLDGNTPAQRVKYKSGFKEYGTFYCGKFFGIEFTTLNKCKYDNR